LTAGRARGLGKTQDEWEGTPSPREQVERGVVEKSLPSEQGSDSIEMDKAGSRYVPNGPNYVPERP